MFVENLRQTYRVFLGPHNVYRVVYIMTADRFNPLLID